MGYSMFKISSLKTEADFKEIITEVNQGSFAYFTCKDYLLKQSYYSTHQLRKNGVIAIGIQFKLCIGESDVIDENRWKKVALLFCRDYLDINIAELKDSSTEEACADKTKILFCDFDSKKQKGTYTIVFTKTRADGKLFLTKYSCAKRGWFKSILRNYEKIMRNTFYLDTAPKEVFYDFLYNKDREAVLTSDYSQLKKLPFPMEGETTTQYYMRITPFVERIKKQRDEDEEKKYSRLNQSYKNLKIKYDVLKEQEVRQRVYLARAGKVMQIIDEYQDFRVLRSDLLQGQRIKAALKFFDLLGDERGEQSIKFIEYALDQGKSFLEDLERKDLIIDESNL
ncbi:hypothetical protein SAMN02910384_03186 [Pseudobutyrivibrio sp. ACV-2]|nr:hypothetical protein SAMN02910384_03186 [Pseudobutyrivibrio sp. ACV-2]